jgi:NAD(P)-dependent dehydrogenase (short-subunit alcohol dehydrogenase family)
VNPPDRGGSGEQGRLALAGGAIMVIATAGSVAPLIARDAIERGARVVLVMNEPATADVPNGPTSIPSDLSSEAEVDRLFDVAVEQLAGLDVVIVVLEAHSLFDLHALPLELWRRRVTEPLQRSFWLARRALDEFVGSGTTGRIIFVVERAHEDPVADGTPVISEAVASLARSLAREYGRWAVACQVVIGAGHRPLVECVLFFASSAASFVTGETITVGSPVAPSLSEPRRP